MTVQITVIGLGQVGTSIGLALEPQKERILRVGHDRKADIARQVEKMGAFDKIINNLHAAVEQADIVVLALHEDQIRRCVDHLPQERLLLLHGFRNLFALGDILERPFQVERLAFLVIYQAPAKSHIHQRPI